MNIVESNLELEIREVEVPAEGPIDGEGRSEKEGVMQAEEAEADAVPAIEKEVVKGIEAVLDIELVPAIEIDVEAESQPFIEIDQDISISAPAEVENRPSPAK